MFMVSARDLEIRHLITLRAVATAGTFGRAAELLGYTQSAVSQQIGALERVVGAPLFDRPGGPRPVELTPLGALLVDHARDVIARTETAAADIERFRAGAIGRVDIGTFQSVSTALLPELIGRLRAERPDVEARLVEIDDEDVLARRVLDGELDLSFMAADEIRDGIEHETLFIDPFVLVALPEDVGDGPVPVDALRGRALIGQTDNQCQRRVDDNLRARGLDPDYVFRANDNAAVIGMVRANVGMAVMPLLAVDTDDPRVAIRDLDPPIPPRRVSIGWRRDRTLSPTAARCVELALEMTVHLRERGLAGVG
jgi:DNA-binding transcriptional LysR family regulator